MDVEPRRGQNPPPRRPKGLPGGLREPLGGQVGPRWLLRDRLWAALGAFLGRPWGRLGTSWVAPGPSWAGHFGLPSSYTVTADLGPSVSPFNGLFNGSFPR